MKPSAIEIELGHSLPDCYAKFLTDYPEGCVASEWRLKSYEELLSPNNVNGSERPFYRVLPEHTAMMEEFCGQDAATNLHPKFGTPSGTPISFWQISKCIAIGEFNGDYLYIDPMEGMSIWVFFHDGCQVQWLAGSFGTWARAAGLKLAPTKPRNQESRDTDMAKQPGLFASTGDLPLEIENSQNLDSVRWEVVPWKDVHLKRCHRDRVKLPKAVTCWKQMLKKLKKHHKAVSHLQPVGPDTPGSLDPLREYNLVSRIDRLERKTSPPRGFMGYYFAREGAVFCARLLMKSRFGFNDGRNSVRKWVCGLDDDAYQEVVTGLAALREASDLETRISLGFLVPDQTNWVLEDLESVLSRPPNARPKNELLLLASLPTLERVHELIGTRPHVFNAMWGYLADLVVHHGAAATPVLFELLGSHPRARKVCARLLALLEQPDVAKFFAGKLLDGELRDIAQDYLEQCPTVAVPALRQIGGSAAEHLLSTLKTADPQPPG